MPATKQIVLFLVVMALLVEIFLLPALAWAEDDGNYVVEINKGKLIRLTTPATSVVVADSDIADVQVVSPNLIYLSGRKVGETSLLAVGNTDNVVLDGTVAVTHNLSKLQASIKKAVPDANIHLASTDAAIVMSGEVESPGKAEQIKRLASTFLQGEQQDIINLMDTKDGDQVMLKVKVAEVSRAELKRFGINLESILTSGNFIFGLATGSDIVTSATGALIRSATGDNNLYGGLHTGSVDINGMIDALGDDGLVTILAEPNLTTKSGVPASFLAGGEFPIPVVGEEDSVTIEYRQFGVSLDFTPVVISKKKISLTVKPEVSTLSNSGSIETNGFKIPTLLTRRASTTVELGSGESFAIAGLLRHDNTNDISKTPALGDVPVLGALFRSNEFRQDQTELVIIVTPYIVKGVQDAQLAAPTDGYRPVGDLDRVLMGRMYKEKDMVPVTGQAVADKTAPRAPGGRHYPKLNGPAGFIIR